MRTLVLAFAIFHTCLSQAADCATISTAGWTQDRINWRDNDARELYRVATGELRWPVTTGQEICFANSPVDVPAVVTASAMQQQYDARQATNAANAAAAAAERAAFCAEVASTCADGVTASQIDTYYNAAFTGSMTNAQLLNAVRNEFKRLAKCLAATRRNIQCTP